MSFIREVPSLQKLLLVYISKKLKSSMFTKSKVQKALSIITSLRTSSKIHKLLLELCKCLIKAGKFNDNTLPIATYFHTSMIKVELLGAKITHLFVQKVSQHIFHINMIIWRHWRGSIIILIWISLKRLKHCLLLNEEK